MYDKHGYKPIEISIVMDECPINIEDMLNRRIDDARTLKNHMETSNWGRAKIPSVHAKLKLNGVVFNESHYKGRRLKDFEDRIKSITVIHCRTGKVYPDNILLIRREGLWYARQVS